MLKDLLKNEGENVPALAFHTMTLCDKIITIYGGLTAKDKFSGDIYFLKLTSKGFIKSEWALNKASKLIY